MHGAMHNVLRVLKVLYHFQSEGFLLKSGLRALPEGNMFLGNCTRCEDYWELLCSA